MPGQQHRPRSVTSRKGCAVTYPLSYIGKTPITDIGWQHPLQAQNTLQ